MLFQSGSHSDIHLFLSKLALTALFLRAKFKRIFYLEWRNKFEYRVCSLDVTMAMLEDGCFSLYWAISVKFDISHACNSKFSDHYLFHHNFLPIWVAWPFDSTCWRNPTGTNSRKTPYEIKKPWGVSLHSQIVLQLFWGILILFNIIQIDQGLKYEFKDGCRNRCGILQVTAVDVDVDDTGMFIMVNITGSGGIWE